MQIQPFDLVGLVLPPVIDLLNMRVKNSNLRYIASLLICVIVGVALNIDKISSWQALCANVGIVFACAQTVHKLYWSNTQGSQKMAPAGV